MTSRMKDTLLLVGDVNSDRAALREIFKETYNLLEAESLTQATMLLRQNDSCIAAVLVDLTQIDDEDVKQVNQAAHRGSDVEIPILSLINFSEDGTREELAFSRGVSDVIHKPYTPASLRRRVQIFVDLHMHKQSLQNLVKEQQKTIRSTNQVMLDALSAIIEHRSTESGNHVLRIRRFTKILLENVEQNFPEYNLTPDAIDIISSAAALHDIGKIAIPDAILNKPGRLTDEEFEIMKSHTTVGGELISTLTDLGDTEYLRYAYNIAMYHHERWDGRGYPAGLSEDDIPICAQVVSVADVFDALTTPRVYKEAYSCAQAINMILNNECGKFSPKLLMCFKNVISQFTELAEQYADGHSPKDDTITMPLPGPTWQKKPPNSTQSLLAKYHTILHYMNDTVLELNLDMGTYQILYNPNPELDDILPDAESVGVSNVMQHIRLHPDDAGIIEEMRNCLIKDYFQQNLRRKSFPCRIFIPAQGDYLPYELIFLRIKIEDENEHSLFFILRRLEQHRTDQVPHASHSFLYAAPALRGLVSSAVRCRNDKALTIDMGTESLTALTGYTETEIAELFSNKLTNLMAGDDLASFRDAMQNTSETGIPVETEFRLLRKEKDPLWVLVKSRAYIENDGQEYIYHAIRDNSRVKTVEYDLRSRIERNQTIIDQSGGIVFEWNIKTDTMYCSPKWEEHFGYAPVSKNYGKQMGIATHFHPDDLPLVRSAIEQIKTNFETICIEVRIASVDAKYLWTRITATAHLDEQGQLTRIIGILQDIDEMKKAELTLRERAERDPLTKLFNKESSQILITEYLTERGEDSLAAMLVLDLDNFKAINDNYGHLYGDSVLSQISGRLRHMFRSHDVIGRIGGDEFLIFLQDIPNEDLVNNRCNSILETFRTLLAQLAPDANASCSIGVSLIPSHGVTFNDLFTRADEALYLSKRSGKNTFTIYDPLQAASNLLEGAHIPTRIDSDAQPGLADSSFVRFLFRRLYESNNIFETFNELLAHVGRQLNVSRVYIFENNDDNTTCSNTFEWCNEGIPPEIDNLQNVSYITDIEGWPDVFDEHGVFYCTDIMTLEPHFRAILEPQGIKSMLQCSIMDNGVFRGYVGFDECFVNRLWTQDQINLLQFLSEALATFLLKKRVQDKVSEQAEDLRTILDRQDIFLYVIDPDTCKLKFLNAKARRSAPHDTDLPCYKAFRNRDSRCENCPALNIHQGKTASTIMEDSCFGGKVRASASEIRWNGEPSCLIFCHELE